MTEKDLNTLDDLISEVESLRKRHTSKYCDVLFRGQPAANYKLESSLERYTDQTLTYADYNNIMRLISHPIASLSENRLFPKYKEQAEENPTSGVPLPNYELMVHARHLGFPSPLLDWTESLYVALFFAYRTIERETEKVSVYSFIEMTESGKSGWRGQEIIWGLGPYINTHRRHFLQQAQYTVASQFVKDNWQYCSHESAFANSSSETQNIRFKFNLPSHLREEVMNMLYDMNITPFSLFSTDDTLMEMLAYKHFFKGL